MVDYGVSMHVGFKLEGFPAEPVAFHLVGEKTLNTLDVCVQLCVDIRSWLDIFRDEVNEPHYRARRLGEGMRKKERGR